MKIPAFWQRLSRRPETPPEGTREDPPVSRRRETAADVSRRRTQGELNQLYEQIRDNIPDVPRDGDIDQDPVGEDPAARARAHEKRVRMLNELQALELAEIYTDKVKLMEHVKTWMDPAVWPLDGAGRERLDRLVALVTSIVERVIDGRGNRRMLRDEAVRIDSFLAKAMFDPESSHPIDQIEEAAITLYFNREYFYFWGSVIFEHCGSTGR